MITIVGAGLVGSLWAVLLRKEGYDVTIFERRKDPRLKSLDSGRSINLIMTSRGLQALELAGLLHKAFELAVPVYGRMIHPKVGDLVYQPYGQKKECNYSISRGDLNLFLIDEAEKAGAKIFFDHELAEISAAQKEVTFKTASGLKTFSYEVLFGADGAGSRVRKEVARIFPDLVQEKTEWLEADYKELTLPLGADGKATLRTDALHIWPRGSHMMMALANRDGSFTMTAYLPKESSAWSFRKITSKQSVQELFESEFPDAIPLMPKYQEEFTENPQGTLGTVRTSKWVFADSIALMGDASHGIVPFFGQGMNSGFEDCTCLLRLIKAPSNTWPTVLKAYEEERKLNTDAIADMALENWVEMRDKVGDSKFMLRKKVESMLEQKHPGTFKARYGMITYTLVPYAMAKKAGELQNQLLDQIIQNATTLEEISWSKADQLLEEIWTPFVKENAINLTPYLPLA